MKRTERLVALLEVLRGRRTGITAEELAERFDVTVRTIYRDLESLRLAEVPLVADRGPGGGFALPRSYTLPPINLTAHEAAVLVSAGRFLVEMRVLPFRRTLKAAMDKIQGALSAGKQRELMGRLASLSYIGVPALEIPVNIREPLEDAWLADRPVSIFYRKANYEGAWRRIRIRQVVMDRNETFLNADDLDKPSDAARQFRLDRIEKVRADA